MNFNDGFEYINALNDDFINLLTETYKENMLLEQILYEDFDKMESILESKISERKDKFIKFLQEQFRRILEWFDNTIKNMSVFYKEGKLLCEQHDFSSYRIKLLKSNTIIKHHNHYTPKMIMSTFDYKINSIYDRMMDYNSSSVKDGTFFKGWILKLVPAEDISDIQRSVFEFDAYMGEKNIKEDPIRRINVKMLMATLTDASDVITQMNKEKNKIKKLYDFQLRLIKNSDVINEQQVKYFNFGINVINAYVRANVSVINAVYKEDLAIAKKIIAEATKDDE